MRLYAALMFSQALGCKLKGGRGQLCQVPLDNLKPEEIALLTFAGAIGVEYRPQSI